MRIRRGLINPVGSIIKALTGNLDNDDAVRYDKLISSMQSKQNVMMNKITLVSEMVDTFVNITNSTRNNFIILEKTIKEIEEILNNTQFQRRSKIVSLSQPCREIDEGKFLCYDSNVSSEEESKCITDLMTFSMKITSCLPVPVNASTIKVKAIQPDSWIIFAGFSTFLTEYCGNDMSQHDIMGTYIITLNNACEVKLGTTTLRKHRLQTGDVEFRSSPAIHLPSIMTPKDTVPRKTISLDEINLENLQFLSHALKDNSEVINSEGHFVNVHSVSIGTIVIYLILLIMLMIAMYRYRHVLVRKPNQNHQPRDEPSDDDFALTEGGVMCSQSFPRIVTISKDHAMPPSGSK
ncbi:unnamed protein product [Spodoptera exigua]|nr:unnamed protein product [Spodoptera exigua]